MISLLEIAHSMNEVDDDKYVSIGFGRFKLKGKEDDDDADVYAKTDSGKYVKSADQESDDDGGEKDKPEPQGSKLSGSDFERDSDAEDDDGIHPDDEKNASEKENEKLEKELQNIAKDKGLTVGSEDANYGGEIHSLVGKDDDPDNTLGFHAAPNFDDDGNMTNEPQYAIELGMGTSPMYFGSKEEADAALWKDIVKTQHEEK